MTMTMDELATLVAEFAAEREWARFHTPRNLATALVVEASELLEPFQWMSETEDLSVEAREAIAGEMADVMMYLLNLANVLKLDLAEATLDKLAVNRRRFPVGHARSGEWHPRHRGTMC